MSKITQLKLFTDTLNDAKEDCKSKGTKETKPDNMLEVMVLELLREDVDWSRYFISGNIDDVQVIGIVLEDVVHVFNHPDVATFPLNDIFKVMGLSWTSFNNFWRQDGLPNFDDDLKAEVPQGRTIKELQAWLTSLEGKADPKGVSV